MSLLFRIIYAAHANGTHHKLALDALNRMERPDAESWQRMFLKHAELYLEGSKAPDNSFKDFKNHVLHVKDGYWGGAPEKVESWYGHLVAALRAGKWADASYAAGVLSHYYTDPVHPFHTGQTEAENAIHRAVEWSINRSYDRLHALGMERFPDMTVTSHTGAHWLKEMTCDAAEFSHRYYEKLIAHYDFKRGVVHPEDGLDEVGRIVVAELLMYATDGFGHLLDRAVGESGVSAPEVSLSLDTIIATLKIPAKWVTKKLTNAEDRRIVEAMYDELQATGRVEHTLPEDDRIIRDLHQREVLDRARVTLADKRAVRVPEGDPAEARKARQQSLAAKAPIAPAAPAGGAGSAANAGATKPPRRIEIDAQLLPDTQADTHGKEPAAQTSLAAAMAAAIPAAATAFAIERAAPASSATDAWPPASPVVPVAATGHESRRVYLSAVDALERAPSIGPKLAERFAALGVKTVADFLARQPQDLAAGLADKRFDAGKITEWQDQAQLVMEVPGLRGTHAQLLTGAGFHTAQHVADAEPVDFAAEILKFAATDAGKQILRDGHAPDVEKIKGWVESARIALAA